MLISCVPGVRIVWLIPKSRRLYYRLYSTTIFLHWHPFLSRKFSLMARVACRFLSKEKKSMKSLYSVQLFLLLKCKLNKWSAVTIAFSIYSGMIEGCLLWASIYEQHKKTSNIHSHIYRQVIIFIGKQNKLVKTHMLRIDDEKCLKSESDCSKTPTLIMAFWCWHISRC